MRPASPARQGYGQRARRIECSTWSRDHRTADSLRAIPHAQSIGIKKERRHGEKRCGERSFSTEAAGWQSAVRGFGSGTDRLGARPEAVDDSGARARRRHPRRDQFGAARRGDLPGSVRRADRDVRGHGRERGARRGGRQWQRRRQRGSGVRRRRGWGRRLVPRGGSRAHRRSGAHVSARDGHDRAPVARGRDRDRQEDRGRSQHRARSAVREPAHHARDHQLAGRDRRGQGPAARRDRSGGNLRGGAAERRG